MRGFVCPVGSAGGLQLHRTIGHDRAIGGELLHEYAGIVCAVNPRPNHHEFARRAHCCDLRGFVFAVGFAGGLQLHCVAAGAAIGMEFLHEYAASFALSTPDQVTTNSPAVPTAVIWGADVFPVAYTRGLQLHRVAAGAAIGVEFLNKDIGR